MLLAAGLVLVIGSLQVSGGLFALTDERTTSDNYLLPDDFIPSKYTITIDVRDSLNNNKLENFRGEVTITATAKKDLNSTTLHAAGMTDLDITVPQYTVLDKTTDDTKETLTIKLKETVRKDQTITINIKYTAKLYSDMHGFYVSSYMEKEVNKTVLTTQFQPTHARRAFPCFDEPKYKATFSLNVLIPDGYTVISNMPAVPTSTATDVKFPATPQMSTYLVAFIVSKFQYRAGPGPEVPGSGGKSIYNVWARPEAKEQTEVAANAMKPIIDDLNKFTGIKYDEEMDKMDMVALPDFSAGAMENWGCLTYRETALLVDKKLSTNRDEQRVVTVIAHEIAHQWFGDLVTLSWWNNTWINEGFARYFEYHTTASYKPEWEMENQFVVEQVQSIFEVDSLEKTTPLTHPVQSPAEISDHFGTISYSKGGSVIRMMEHFLGRDIFKEGLQTYLKANRYKNTMPEDLWASLEKISKEKQLPIDYTVEKIMTNWISKKGFPLVTVNVTNQFASFCQKRFLLNPEKKATSNDFWYIPISYKNATNYDFKDTKPNFWLTPNEPCKLVDIKNSSWFIVNTNQTGYYRVNYNQEHWNLLANVLNDTKTREPILKINRAQLVDDAMNLAKAGVLPYGTAFNLTDYLLTETDYFPWYSAFRCFRFLLQRYAENDQTGKYVREYVKNLTVTLVDGKDFPDPAKKETQLEVFNRVQALEWSCNLDVQKCIDSATEQFKKIDNIPKNVRSIVYCTAIKHDKTNKNWDTLWGKYLNSNVAAEKISIINALGCTKNEKKLLEFLNKSVEGKEIRSQDASYVFSSVYTGTLEGVHVALTFLKDRADAIRDSYGGMNALNKAALGLAGRLTTTEDKKKLTEALKHTNFDIVRDAAIEVLDDNIKWAEKHEKDIGELLKDRLNSAASLIISRILMFSSLGFISIYLTKFT